MPALQFAAVDGAIEPGSNPDLSPAFAAALQALYGVSYTLKFALKKRAADPVDYPVMPLEALWWIEMIMQPDVITPELFADAVAVARKKKGDSEAFDRIRLETFREGLCVQMMHVGPYATEPATKDKMEAFAREQGYEFTGKHHEIYLGDPRQADPAKLKTVLRYPVRRAAGSE
ncbi:MAG: GyrI-like domain-containing protein [Anaerolineae bacterium]|nr:GyrI-like domain-containing protein [Anaerolineae bacterium]